MPEEAIKTFIRIKELMIILQNYFSFGLPKDKHRWKMCVSNMKLFILLTHISLASFLWDIGKQCKTRSDAAASDQILHCLLTDVPFRI